MRSGKSGSRVPSFAYPSVPRPAFLGVALVVASLVIALAGAAVGSIGRHGQVRAVLSTQAPGERVLSLSTSSLYARNDPWKAYLAPESVCPGGERTDLPAPRQVKTVACLINYARRRRGLRELAVRQVLSGASVEKAKEIVRCVSFAHNPCGGDWKTAVRATGYEGRVGENLYLATGRWGAPRVAVDGWLNSPAHRENLFSAQWREQGLALLWTPSFGGYSDVSLWVSVMGTR